MTGTTLETIYSRVAGVSFRQPWIRLLHEKGKERRLQLVREPTNPADPNAIAVYALIPDHGWHHIGYLTRRVARDVAQDMDAGYYVYARITEFTGGTEDKPTIGINIEIVVTDSKEKPPFHVPFLIPPEPYAFPKAGFFAPAHIKDFFKALHLYLSGRYANAFQAWLQVASQEPTAALFAALYLARSEDPQDLRQAVSLLSPLIRDKRVPTPLMREKLNLHIALPISADLIPVSPDKTLPLTLPVFALVLAGLHVRLRQFDETLQILRHFAKMYPDDLILALALARAYNLNDNYEETLILLSDIDFSEKNNITLALLEAYVTAFLQQEEFKPALHALSRSNYIRKTTLSPTLLQRLRFLHAQALWGAGKKSKALQMLEELRAEAPNFPSLRETLQKWRKDAKQKPRKPSRKSEVEN